jgi:hypothetical protein
VDPRKHTKGITVTDHSYCGNPILNIRIVLSKLFPRRLLGKAPPDSGSDRIPLLLSSAPLTGQRLAIAKAAIQALFGYGGELNFRHVRPTAFFRSVMIVKLLRE